MSASANTPKTIIRPEGTWTIASAKSTDGRSYSGTVQIQPMGQVYMVSWLTTLSDYTGLAFFEDGHLFAGCGVNDAYGVTIYKINQDGTLDGRWITPHDKGVVKTEKARGGTPDRIEGSYKIEGTISDFEIYQGELNIVELDDIYQFSWSIGSQYQGVGLRVGNWLVVGWGPSKVYCLHYEIQGFKARGRWTSLDRTQVGEEILEKIC